MAQIDRASGEQTIAFEKAKQKVLETASSLLPEERFYLEEVLGELEVQTAFYSYGNGEVPVMHNLSEIQEVKLLYRYLPILEKELRLSLTVTWQGKNNISSDGINLTKIWFDDPDDVIDYED